MKILVFFLVFFTSINLWSSETSNKEMPKHNWSYYQEWNRAIFLHWEVELEELKPFVPDEIEIDLFKGKPWVSLVAFTMEKIRPRFLPPFSPISNLSQT